MAKGTENITQIASDLGYDNFYYFTKVFSKEYGCTPTEYAGRLKKRLWNLKQYRLVKNMITG